MTTARTARGAALAAAALLLTGCGVRPTGVVDAGAPAGGLTKGLRIYFVSETGRLEGVSRPERRISEPAAVIKLLMSGPDPAERRSGLTTLVESGQFEVGGEGNRIAVRVRDVPLDPTSVSDRNYIGQLVCSLARARAVLDTGGRTRPDDVRVTVRPAEGRELGPYVCSDFLT